MAVLDRRLAEGEISRSPNTPQSPFTESTFPKSAFKR